MKFVRGVRTTIIYREEWRQRSCLTIALRETRTLYPRAVVIVRFERSHGTISGSTPHAIP